MRYVYLAIVTLLVLATAAFALQNFETVSMSFLGFSVRAPLSVLVTVVYVLGAVTGSAALALLRRVAEGSRRHVLGES